MIDAAFGELEPLVGTRGACEAIGRSRASHYRHVHGPRLGPPKPRPTPANALGIEERAAVLAALHSERFVDRAPAQVVLSTPFTIGRRFKTRGMSWFRGGVGHLLHFKTPASQRTWDRDWADRLTATFCPWPTAA